MTAGVSLRAGLLALFLCLVALPAWGFVEEGDTLGDWEVVEVDRHPEFYRVWLEGPGGRTGLEVVVDSGPESEWSTGAHRLMPAPGTQPPGELLELAIAALKARDANKAPALALSAEEARRIGSEAGPEGAQVGSARQHAFRRLFAVSLVAGLGAGILLLLGSLRRLELPVSPSDGLGRRGLAIGLLSVAALALRLVDAPWTVANVNGHGNEYIQTAMEVQWSMWLPYNNGYYWLYNTIFRLGAPAVGETIMVGNAVLGAASVAGLYALVRVLTGDRWSALGAAGLLAVLPMHVRFSVSEDMPALVLLLQVLVMLGAAVAARSPGWQTFGAVAALLAFAVQVRPELWLLVPMALVVFAAVGGREQVRRAVRGWEFWAVAALLGLALAPTAAALVDTVRAGGGAQDSIDWFSHRPWLAMVSAFGLEPGLGNLTLNPTYTSPLIGLLALVGLGRGLQQRWAFVVIFAVFYVAFGLPAMNFQMGVLPSARLQLGYQWIPVGLAGIGLGWGLARVPRTGPRAAVLTAVLVASYVPHRAEVRREYTPQLAYAFEREALREIPDVCTLVLLDPIVDDVLTAVPEWIPAYYGRVVRVEPASEFLARGGPSEGECAAWYRSHTCFTFQPHAPGTIRPLCAQMDGLAFEKVLASTEVPALQPGTLAFSVDPVPLELRLLQGPSDGSGGE